MSSNRANLTYLSSPLQRSATAAGQLLLPVIRRFFGRLDINGMLDYRRIRPSRFLIIGKMVIFNLTIRLTDPILQHRALCGGLAKTSSNDQE